MARKPAARKVSAQRREDGGLWDSPRALTLIADAILLLASVAIGYAAVVFVTRMPVMPLQAVTLTRAPANLSSAQIEDAARRAVNGSFLTTDIERARSVFESLPWVRHASVRRVWPGSLEIELEEHVPVARWWVPDNAPPRMVNAQGELFFAEHEASLPLFAGPDERSSTMLARHIEWTGTLAPLHRQIRKLTLTRREAWQVQLDDGARLELGRDDDKLPIAERLERYVATQPEVLQHRDQKVIYADLRYPNGYALRLSNTEHQEKP